ncbi:transposase domain-containing protein [Pseudomonas taetrolens]
MNGHNPYAYLQDVLTRLPMSAGFLMPAI